MRIVVLTTRSRRGSALLRALIARNIEIHAIVIDRGALGAREGYRKTLRTMRRRGIPEVARRVRARLRRALKGARRRDGGAGYHAYSQTVRVVSDPNTDAGVEVIRQLEPDLLVLGSVRLLTRRVLGIPRIGVLNGHPGLLPDYRGVDVIPWAIYHGNPLGVTVHVVDPGVDTGPIVAQRVFAVVPGDTLESLADRAATIGAEVMAEVVERVLSAGRIEGEPQDLSRGRTYTRMPPHLRRLAEERLAQQHRHPG